jgi:lactate dehydrogenase-like 2-hydroxyacid dehydrogenase
MRSGHKHRIAVSMGDGISKEVVLEAGEKLKVISRHGVGYDNIDVAVSR